MKTLRNQAIKNLLAELDRTIFTQHAFEATFNGRDGKLIELVYKERPEFRFIETNTLLKLFNG